MRSSGTCRARRASPPRRRCCSAAATAESEDHVVLRLDVLVLVLALGHRMNVDVVDAPLVLLLAEHDAEAHAVLVPAQLGPVGADLLELAVDLAIDAGEEALDLAGQTLATPQ